MFNFTYNIPTKVYFGDNQLSNLGKEIKKFGKKSIALLWWRFYKKNWTL